MCHVTCMEVRRQELVLFFYHAVSGPSTFTVQPSHQHHILLFRACFRDPHPDGQAHTAGTEPSSGSSG